MFFRHWQANTENSEERVDHQDPGGGGGAAVLQTERQPESLEQQTQEERLEMESNCYSVLEHVPRKNVLVVENLKLLFTFFTYTTCNRIEKILFKKVEINNKIKYN